LTALVLGGGAEVVECPLDLLTDLLGDEVQDRLDLDPAHGPLLTPDDRFRLGGSQVESLGDRRGVLPAADEDVPRVDVEAALHDVRVRGLVTDVHECHDLVALTGLVVLVLRLQREDVDVHDHDVQPAGLDDVRVALDLALLDGDQHDLELRPVLPQDLEIDVDVIDVERDVLLRLPADRLAQLALRHLRQVDPLGDHRAPGDADDGLRGLDAALDQRLPDRLLHGVWVLDLAPLDRPGRNVGDSEPGQLVPGPLRLELYDLDGARADVQADYFGSLLLLPERHGLFLTASESPLAPTEPQNYFFPVSALLFTCFCNNFTLVSIPGQTDGVKF
jgi:hypothetical protein